VSLLRVYPGELSGSCIAPLPVFLSSQDDVRSHPVSKLDTPAMTFLVSCQIAAGLERRSRAGPRVGVKADGGDASHLFRQVRTMTANRTGPDQIALDRTRSNQGPWGGD
jgi:hypothetical protein